jgi:hypothetical protein
MGESVDMLEFASTEPILVATDEQHLDFAIGLILLGEQGRNELLHYLRMLGERECERQQLAEAS